MTLLDKYPAAYTDDKGTVWVSREACESADWTFANGDGFLEEILGWDWQEAEDNFAWCQRADKRKAFWSAHPRLRKTCKFLRCWYGAISMFVRTVGRQWYEGRIGPSLAWDLARGVWLE